MYEDVTKKIEIKNCDQKNDIKIHLPVILFLAFHTTSPSKILAGIVPGKQ